MAELASERADHELVSLMTDSAETRGAKKLRWCGSKIYRGVLCFLTTGESQFPGEAIIAEIDFWVRPKILCHPC
jgi:hypothetical protein